MNDSTADSKSRLALAAAISTMFMWAFGIVAVKSVDMPGVQIAFWRVVMAALAYLVVLRVAGRRLTVAHLRLTALPALAFSVEVAVFFVALKLTTVANATVIGAMQPLVLMLVASRRFGERVSAVVILSGAVALVGVGLVVFGSSLDATWSLEGDLLAVLAMVLFAAYFAMAKQARGKIPALEFQAGIWIIGAFVLLPVSLIEEGGVFLPSGWNWAWMALLVLIPGTGHLLMNWAHTRVRLVTASMLTLAVPALSTAGAVVFLDESAAVAQWVGMVVVLGALALVIKRETEVPDPIEAQVQ